MLNELTRLLLVEGNEGYRFWLLGFDHTNCKLVVNFFFNYLLILMGFWGFGGLGLGLGLG
jgi:hypothetical protein